MDTVALPCATDPDLFFSDDPGETARAKAACLTCPLQFACLDRVLNSPEQWGVFAGYTAEERGTPYVPLTRDMERAERKSDLLALVEREPGLSVRQYAGRVGMAPSSVDFILRNAQPVGAIA